MRIAYFTETLPPLVDGVARTLSHLVETLENHKVDFRFYSPVRPDASLAWRHRVRKVPALPFLPYRGYRIGLPFLAPLITDLDHFQPDLIHVVNPTLLGLRGLIYGRHRHIPVVSSYHTHFVFYFNYHGFNSAEKIGWSYLKWFHNQCNMTYAPSSRATLARFMSTHLGQWAFWERFWESGSGYRS